MAILSTILVGFVVGAIAKLLMPGKDPGGFIVTILLGIAGAFIATYLGPSPRLVQGGTTSGLDHVDHRRRDPVAAVSVAFQAQTVAFRYRGEG
jgi:Predicted membrane protein